MIVELLRFTIGTDVLTYTSGQLPVEHEGRSYEPIMMSHNKINAGEQAARSPMTLRMPRDIEVASYFVGGPPATIVEIEMFEKNDSTTQLVWLGRVVTMEWSRSEAIAECETIFTSMKRTGVRARYQKRCRHALYGEGCTLDQNDFRVDAVLTARTDKTLTAAAFATKPNGWFTSGEVVINSLNRRAAIVNHVGTIITLGSPIFDSEIGNEVVAFAGCNHLYATCDTKFANTLNYGGMPFIPKKNPFGDDPIF